jgi:hypothetical protein
MDSVLSERHKALVRAHEVMDSVDKYIFCFFTESMI